MFDTKKEIGKTLFKQSIIVSDFLSDAVRSSFALLKTGTDN